MNSALVNSTPANSTPANSTPANAIPSDETSADAAKPLVSVVVPVYNRGALIEKTVQSALAQTLPARELEILLVDDGSTDETASILRRLYGDEARVRLFRVENGGVARARNFGLERARGEWIAFLDHDDMWAPDKLARQLEAARSGEVGVVHCDWRAVDETGAPMPALFQISRQRWWRGASGWVYPWVWMPHPAQFLRNPVISMSVPLIQTALLRESGGFDARLVPSDDWDVWIGLARRTKWAFVPQVLVDYVCHDGQQHNDTGAAYLSWLRLCRKHPVPARRFPLVWLKQRLLIRYCRAFGHLGAAQRAARRGDVRLLALCTIRAAWQRPDILLTNRWRRVWREALAPPTSATKHP